MSLLTAGSAQARPSFDLGTSSARAGDVVHFGISGVDGWGVAYHLELAGEDLLGGRSKNSVAGTFTMPDLGEEAITVNLDAWLRWSDTKARTKRSLEYRGPALPPAPPAPPPGTVPAGLPLAPPVSEQGDSPAPGPGSSPSKQASPKPHGARRKARTRHHTTSKPSSAASGGERLRATRRVRGRHARDTAARHRRSKQSLRRIAPLRDGGGASAGEGPAHDQNASTQNAPRVAIAAPRRGLHDGIDASIVVPALFTLGGLKLLGVAVLRRRWLASRSAQS